MSRLVLGFFVGMTTELLSSFCHKIAILIDTNIDYEGIYT